MDVSAVDLFCGTGGLTRGLEARGVSVEAGFDVEPRCKYPYESNNSGEFVRADLSRPAASTIQGVHRKFDTDAEHTLLAACAPCQPFSTLNHGSDSTEHDKWGLLRSVQTIAEEIQPDFVVMENVHGVRNHDVYERTVRRLSDEGYWINSDENKLVYCPEYGIPQKRKRWVVIASREGPVEMVDPEYTDESEYPTVKETIDELPPIEAGETHPDDPLHTARTLSDTNLERIEISKPGSSWELWKDKGRSDLLLPCHQKESGRSYTAVYGRMVPDEPAPTITTQFYNYGSGRFGHYDTDQNRALSLREGAMLQTFPRDYQFVPDEDDVEAKILGEFIGNAVPPRLGEVIAESIRQHVDDIDRQTIVQDYAD